MKSVDWLKRNIRVRDRSRVNEAIEKQDEIREKAGSGNLSEEVRKWRDKRK